MSELLCNIDTSFAKYNCGASGDANDFSGSDNSWYNSNEGSTKNPSLGIYSGYASWNDSGDNPRGNFNWRSVIRFTVPLTLPKSAQINELVVGVPVKGSISTSYPHHSYVILSSTAPYSNGSGIKPNELCEEKGIKVTSGGKKRYLDHAVKKNIAIGVPTDSRAYAYLVENGKYVRASKKIDYDTILYYRLLPTSITPGGTYYLYFVRQGSCTSGCIRGGSASGHGVSGYVHLRITNNDSSFVKINYTNSVNFSLSAKLDGGTSVDDFAEYGKASFKLGDTQYTDKTSFDAKVTPGTEFKLTRVNPNSGYRYTGSLHEFKITSNKTQILEFATEYTLTFTGDGGVQKTQTKLKGATYSMPTYESLFGEVPVGKVFSGWKNGETTYQPGKVYSIDNLTNKTFSAILSGQHYKLKYRVDGKIVYEQPVIYGEPFIILPLSGDYMKSDERILTGWAYNGTEFIGGTWSHTNDVEITAEFSSKNYELKFIHNEKELASINVSYGASITDILLQDLDVYVHSNKINTQDFDSSYQKLDGWILDDGSSPDSWSNLVKQSSVDGVITLRSVIVPRYKIVVYKNGKWKVTSLNVSCETLDGRWKPLYPKIL